MVRRYLSIRIPQGPSRPKTKRHTKIASRWAALFDFSTAHHLSTPIDLRCRPSQSSFVAATRSVWSYKILHAPFRSSRLKRLSPVRTASAAMASILTMSRVQFQDAELSARLRANIRALDRAAENAPAPRVNLSAAQRPQQTAYRNVYVSLHQTSKALAPSYETVALEDSHRRRLQVRQREEIGSERLPSYFCSVAKEGVLSKKTEMLTPFKQADDRSWKKVYVKLSGTCLNVHRVKYTAQFGEAEKIVVAGRLLRSYTLQHAEVGLATDVEKVEYIPVQQIAKFIPVMARARCWARDSQLFEPRKQYSMRLRLETEQSVFCHESSENILDWLEAICSAIDLALPLDDRSFPQYQTLPRRRRRNNGMRDAARLTTLTTDNPADSLIRQQERIIREHYPHLGALSSATSSSSEALPRADAPSLELPLAPLPGADPEMEDLDVGATFGRRSEPDTASSADRSPSAISRPHLSRQSTSDTILTIPIAMRSATATSHTPSSSTDEKWSPEYTYTAERHMRYRRRCAPVLTADMSRASNVMILAGQRVKMHYTADFGGLLIPFNEKPPSYRSHGFSAPLAPTAAAEEVEHTSTSRSLSSSSSSSVTAPSESVSTASLHLPELCATDSTTSVSGSSWSAIATPSAGIASFPSATKLPMGSSGASPKEGYYDLSVVDRMERGSVSKASTREVAASIVVPVVV